MYLTSKAYPKRAVRTANSALCLAFLILAAIPVHAQRFVKVVNTVEELARAGIADVHTNVFVADPDRGGLFILSTRATTNSGTAFASTNATKQWNRQYGGTINTKWFGLDSTGTTEGAVALTAAVAAANAAGQELLIPAGRYRFAAGTALTFANIPSVIATGASLTNLKVSLSANVRWQGGYFTHASPVNANAIITVAGDHVTVDGVRMYYPPTGNLNTEAYTGIQFTGGDFGAIQNCVLDMGDRSCLTVLGGSQGRIQNLRIRGGDDGIVFKNTVAANATQDWVVQGILSEYNANVVSIGTEITNAVRNITMTGLVGTNVTSLLWIKPGHANYGTNALVENISITHSRAYDTNGTRMQQPIYITGLMKARIRGVYIEDVGAIGRAFSDGVVRAWVHLFANDIYIADVTLKDCWFRDNEAAALSGQGFPFLFGVYLEEVGNGGITNTLIDNVLVDGTYLHGFIEEGTDIAQTKIQNWRSRNTNIGGGTNVIFGVTAPELRDIEIESGLTYPIWPYPGVMHSISGVKMFRGPFLSLDIPAQINDLITKGTIAPGDNFVIEDSASGFGKKVVTYQSIVNSATNLIHTDKTNEIVQLITKGEIEGQDVFVIEDNDTDFGKKVVTMNTIRNYVNLMTSAFTNTLATADRVAIFNSLKQLTNSATINEAELGRLDGLDTNLITHLQLKQDAFTTGIGVTNIANVLSGTYAPGTNIVFVTNANNVTINVGTNGVTDTDGYTLLPIVTTTDGTQTPIFTNTVANNSMVLLDAQIDAINSNAAEARHVAIHWIGLNTAGTVSANATSFISETFVAPGGLADDWAVNRIVASPSANQWVITVQNNSASPTETVKWQMRYKITTLAP